MDKVTEYLCPCCGNVKPIRSFYPYTNPKYAIKTLPICTSCMSRLFNWFYKTTEDERASLWLLCAMVNIPFLNPTYVKAKVKIEEKETKGPLWEVYVDSVKQDGNQKFNFLNSDRMLTDFLIDYQSPRMPNQDDKDMWILRVKKEWGNYTREEYEFLEDMYRQYTEDDPNLDVAKSFRYRDLCKAELVKRRADESGILQDIAKAQDNISKLMGMLNLDKFNSKAVSPEEKHIEKIIKLVEDTRPCECEDLEKYKDFSGFEKTFDNIMRSLKNLIAGTREYPDVPRDER